MHLLSFFFSVSKVFVELLWWIRAGFCRCCSGALWQHLTELQRATETNRQYHATWRFSSFTEIGAQKGPQAWRFPGAFPARDRNWKKQRWYRGNYHFSFLVETGAQENSLAWRFLGAWQKSEETSTSVAENAILDSRGDWRTTELSLHDKTLPGNDFRLLANAVSYFNNVCTLFISFRWISLNVNSTRSCNNAPHSAGMRSEQKRQWSREGIYNSQQCKRWSVARDIFNNEKSLLLRDFIVSR